MILQKLLKQQQWCTRGWGFAPNLCSSNHSCRANMRSEQEAISPLSSPKYVPALIFPSYLSLYFHISSVHLHLGVLTHVKHPQLPLVPGTSLFETLGPCPLNKILNMGLPSTPMWCSLHNSTMLLSVFRPLRALYKTFYWVISAVPFSYSYLVPRYIRCISQKATYHKIWMKPWLGIPGLEFFFSGFEDFRILTGGLM